MGFFTADAVHFTRACAQSREAAQRDWQPRAIDLRRTQRSQNATGRGAALHRGPPRPDSLRHRAVCLLPGTETVFDRDVRCEPSFGIGILPNKKIGQRLARFQQINMDKVTTHPDALELPNGKVNAQHPAAASRRTTRGRSRGGKNYGAKPFAFDLSTSFSRQSGSSRNEPRHRL